MNQRRFLVRLVIKLLGCTIARECLSAISASSISGRRNGDFEHRLRTARARKRPCNFLICDTHWSGMEVFIIVTVLWIFSVCIHEFGHAWAAYRGGDYTVRDKGYLTLNPLHYTHPVYSLLMPVVLMMLGGIGLPGGAVYIERQLLKSRAWDTWVSLAGPAMNLLIIIPCSLAFTWGLVPRTSD